MTRGVESPEELLHGGEINDVVRVGNTVRRASRPSTPTVHALLKHLEAVGFEESPRVVGFDEQGREVLTFIDGEVTSGNMPLPDYLWTEETIVEVAALLRRLHEATASFEVPDDAEWWPVNNRPGRRVICHNDIAPWNLVFREERPVGVIDWDLAAPGPVTSDIARALWFFAPLTSTSTMSLRQRAARIRLFCESYGLADYSQILDRVLEEELDVFDAVRVLAAQGSSGYQGLWGREDWHAGMKADRDFLEMNMPQLRAFLEETSP